MSIVGVRELKNRLTHYLQRAKQGKAVIVTEQGTPLVLTTWMGCSEPLSDFGTIVAILLTNAAS